MLAVAPEFSRAQVIVVGDVMLDRYWSGDASRISPEAPVPVVKIKGCEERVGGAANVALNITKLGGQVKLIGVVGDDAEGEVLKQLLEDEGVECDFIVQKFTPTICKLRVMARHQQLIRLDFEESSLNFNSAELADKMAACLPETHTVVFSDYGKGTLAHVAQYIAQAKKAGAKVLIDPKGVDYSRYAQADIITPNYSELIAVVGDSQSEQELIDKGRGLLRQNKIANLLLTRGEAGMSLIQEQQVHSLPTQAKDVFDVTGAGDTVIAVMALSVALNMSLYDSMYLANLAAGIVVGKLGTSTVSLQELTKAMHGSRSSVFGTVSEDELNDLLAGAKANGERIVMTNGCFDLLHAGHVTYLEQARELGDRLVVAVNSDASVKLLKGDSRPINGLQARMAVLSALACVDWVVPFDEETPERLYCKLLPDVIVKGGDYKPDEVAGADCVVKAGGEVKILQFVEGHSTTSMIDKAKGGEA